MGLSFLVAFELCHRIKARASMAKENNIDEHCVYLVRSFFKNQLLKINKILFYSQLAFMCISFDNDHECKHNTRTFPFLMHFQI